MTSQQYNNIVNFFIKKMGFREKKAETKSEKVVAADLKENRVFASKKKIPHHVTLANDKKVYTTKSKDKNPTMMTLVSASSDVVDKINKILDKSSHSMIRNNGLSSAGSLVIHDVKRKKYEAMRVVSKLRKEGHDAYMCKVGGSVSLVPSLDIVMPHSGYASAADVFVEYALITELIGIYDLFKSIANRAGENNEAIKHVPKMLFYSLIDRSVALEKIFSMWPSYDSFDKLRNRIGHEKIEFVKYYLSTAMATMSRGTGYVDSIRVLMNILDEDTTKFKWLKPHTDDYKESCSYIIEGIFKISEYMRQSKTLAVDMYSSIPIKARTSPALYRTLMHQVRNYSYRSGLMKMLKDDLLAIAATKLPYQDVICLDALLKKLQTSIMIDDKRYRDSLEIGLIHDNIPPCSDDIPFFEFVSNVMSSTYMSLPLGRVADKDKYISRLLRLKNQPVRSIVKLFDPSINITDKMNILGPLFKITNIIQQLSDDCESVQGLVNQIDSKIMQLPLDWFIKMFDTMSNSDESLSQILTCMSLIKSILTDDKYQEVFLSVFKTLCKVISDAGGRALLEFLNQYDPSGSDEEIGMEEMAESIKSCSLGYIFEEIEKRKLVK